MRRALAVAPDPLEGSSDDGLLLTELRRQRNRFDDRVGRTNEVVRAYLNG